MRSLIILFISLVLQTEAYSANLKTTKSKQKSGTAQVLSSASKSSASGKTATPSSKKSSSSSSVASSLSESDLSQLNQALKMVQSGQYQQAVPVLYNLSRRIEMSREKMQIKYILGTALAELGLNQIAAFQFVEVIRNGNSKYVKLAIDKLSLAADALGDDTLLNYAVSKVNVNELPEAGRDLIFFRLGEIKLKNGQFSQAADLFTRVPEGSRYFFLSRYNRGLALLEDKKPNEAISVFKALINYRIKASVTDTNKVVSQLALARAYYQASDWENAILTYREIPRDHTLWHDALFESSWAMLRAAKFRSAISNFQSLHSSYYEDFYIPESLLLRSIVYLYICKYDEMEKVLNLFERTYGPVRSQMGSFLNTHTEPLAYYNEIEAASLSTSGKPGARFKLPIKISNHILREGNVKRALQYLKNLNDEKVRLESYQNLSHLPIGAMGRKILNNRYQNAKIAIGEMVKVHLVGMRNELKDLYEQAGFIRYEMINGKKEQIKKRIAGKEVPHSAIDEDVDKSMYAQNGYEYWPFDGEYWLDEIGNYHYLGKQSCE